MFICLIQHVLGVICPFEHSYCMFDLPFWVIIVHLNLQSNILLFKLNLSFIHRLDLNVHMHVLYSIFVHQIVQSHF